MYNYAIMSNMTAEEKIDYFLENALLPTNTDDTQKIQTSYPMMDSSTSS